LDYLFAFDTHQAGGVDLV